MDGAIALESTGSSMAGCWARHGRDAPYVRDGSEQADADLAALNWGASS